MRTAPRRLGKASSPFAFLPGIRSAGILAATAEDGRAMLVVNMMTILVMIVSSNSCTSLGATNALPNDVLSVSPTISIICMRFTLSDPIWRLTLLVLCLLWR